MGAAGYPPETANGSDFCTSTERAVQAFQRDRGLHDHGRCDEATWLALVEASWRLGDRALLLTAPYLRGDDVVALQSTLGRLGFDCGRIDGIFGPTTANALTDFQRNCGLELDGVCGPFTVRALEVNGARTGSGPGVAALRELVRLGTMVASLDGLRVVIGQFGGLSPLTRQLGQQLRHHGANVVAVDQPDASVQAAAANRHAATVYLGFESHVDAAARVAYYATHGFQSAGGHALAAHLVGALATLSSLPHPMAAGMRLTVLRETRMTAVVCAVGPVQRVIDGAAELSEAVVAAVEAWTAAPVTAPAPSSVGRI
ncbi:MAG: peptidoglycan-binding protein [Actinomycetota bacterium]|nr:peptidoglycan-binding protein [Actinomycetota bacterium]